MIEKHRELAQPKIVIHGKDEFHESLTFSTLWLPCYVAPRDCGREWDLQSASFRGLSLGKDEFHESLTFSTVWLPCRAELKALLDPRAD